LLTFDLESQITKFDEICFQGCVLKSMCAPLAVRGLSRFCFRDAQIEMFMSETESQLSDIDEL
jgi:hypothetical protein